MKVPFLLKDDRKCFVCGPENPAGLHVNFQCVDGRAVAEFTPGEIHQGWCGIVHGGLIGLLLDEAIAYAAYFHGVNALTARVETRFRKVVEVGRKLRIHGEVIKKKRRLLWISATAYFEDGTLAAEADATMYVVHDQQGDAGTVPQLTGDRT